MTKELFEELAFYKTEQILIQSDNILYKQTQNKINKIYEKCDHIYPCSKSAIEGTFFYNMCMICVYNDM